jgi:arginyl-tRNA--protein-N-Asp/Glu arginylyltransferase
VVGFAIDMEYLHFNEKIISDFSQEYISRMYDSGYVFTRIGKGVMHETRSVRIDLSKFSLSSENRRILKKIDGLDLSVKTLPLKDYDWNIGKVAKDFYEKKFGKGIFSAQKIKEILTSEKSNFNTLLEYRLNDVVVGNTICYQSKDILHYSYPFYNLESVEMRDIGLGMMIQGIEYAKNSGKKYVYLGSLQRPGDKYKLQFEGLEWWDGKMWQNDIEKVKLILNER